MKEPPIQALTFYQHNRYRSLLPFHLPVGKSGEWRVQIKTHRKGETLDVISMRNALFMGLRPSRIKLESDTRIHFLKQGGGTWMSTVPQEVEQCQRQLMNFSGRVLVGGLGLGLAVGILELNPRVSEIDVVEISEDVINLIEPYLPQNKTTVWERDLYSFLRMARKNKTEYDYAFYDIWCPTGQRTLTDHVIPLRKLSRGIVRQHCIECWNEEEMLGQVRMGLNTLVHFVYGSNQFRTLPKDLYRDANPEQYAFFNWLRMKRPTTAEADEAIEGYVTALKDPGVFSKYWGKWNKP